MLEVQHFLLHLRGNVTYHIASGPGVLHADPNADMVYSLRILWVGKRIPPPASTLSAMQLSYWMDAVLAAGNKVDQEDITDRVRESVPK
jgi:hypothetical protein